jgi:cytoskeletal protein CcmA (bactofilin family)
MSANPFSVERSVERSAGRPVERSAGATTSGGGDGAVSDWPESDAYGETPVRRPSDAAPDAGEVVVGARCSFDGLIAFQGRARIDGELNGSVVGRGSLRVGEHARVEGTIEADELVVLGHLSGDAIVRGRVELGPDARVVGSIRARRVALAEGCVLEGRCEMPPHDRPDDSTGSGG